MKIIQISDLHISDKSDIEIMKHKADKMHEVISNTLSVGEEVICCVLGDIIDKSAVAMFDKARSFFEYFRDLFRQHKFHYEFVPGNHDLYRRSLREFDTFISNLTSEKYSYNTGENIIVREYNGLSLVLMNSSFHRDHQFGKIDIPKLERIKCNHPTIFLTHHTLMSENDDDISSIRNSYKLISQIERNNAVALLHGHTHGYKDITLGNRCMVVGVGPMFKNVEGVNNQFNLIDLTGSTLESIKNFRYNNDLDSFNSIIIYEKKQKSNYFGSNLEILYKQVVEDTKNYDVITNLRMEYVASFSDFENSIIRNFADSIDIARAWQEPNVPEILYYNHGSYMKTDKVNGLDYVTKELNTKATSSRAIIPLISFDNVVISGDNFLPSFDIVQFGFENESKTDLIVTLYLRALEVNNFLRINLCELFEMIKYIKSTIRSIKDVKINILAFRAQYKEKYGCFRKNEIDMLTEAEITDLVICKDNKLIELLVEKVDSKETVIKDEGLKRTRNALKIGVKKGLYNDSVLVKLDDVLNCLENLKMQRCLTSNYAEIKKYEDELDIRMAELITELKRGRE